MGVGAGDGWMGCLSSRRVWGFPLASCLEEFASIPKASRILASPRLSGGAPDHCVPLLQCLRLWGARW